MTSPSSREALLCEWGGAPTEESLPCMMQANQSQQVNDDKGNIGRAGDFKEP